MGLNKVVEFSTAKLLKEKGFDGNYFHYWNMINHSGEWKVGTRIWEYTDNYIEAPTIAEVVMWLYEKYGIWVTVDININGKFNYLLRQFNSKDRAWEVKNPSSIQEYFNNPNDAYISGIAYFLNNLEMSK